jgi:glycosyltransferase involved in cell wall biosynthesis
VSSRYLLISPCRDEARFLPATIASIARQSALPARWVIVDDGSTDATPGILREAAARHRFIEVVRREDRGRRSVGPGVIDAFYAGLARVELDDYDFVGKLDADLELPERYFERVLARFAAEPRLGNFSGKVYLRGSDGRVRPERMGDENAIGAAKFYRVACFREIGGFVREVCWDGIDGHLCRMKGWIARSVDEPELRLMHLRPMGSSEGGVWRGRKRWGAGKWFMGSAWYYLLAVAVYRMAEPPYGIGGLGILVGYFEAAARRSERFDDREFRRHLRRYELRSLVLGRRRTAEAYHRRCAALASGSP